MIVPNSTLWGNKRQVFLVSALGSSFQSSSVKARHPRGASAKYVLFRNGCIPLKNKMGTENFSSGVSLASSEPARNKVSLALGLGPLFIEGFGPCHSCYQTSPVVPAS